MLTARPASLTDVEQLSPNLRTADILELMASSGRTPHDALLHALQLSKLTWSIEKQGTVVGMFGIADNDMFPDVGIPWLLSSDEINSCPVEFLRGSRRFISKFQKDYRVLTNYVDLRHTAAQRWLEWCGFTKYTVVPRYGVGETPFIQYVRY